MTAKKSSSKRVKQLKKHNITPLGLAAFGALFAFLVITAFPAFFYSLTALALFGQGIFDSRKESS